MLLKNISYYHTGGTAEKIYAPADIVELSGEIKTIHENQVPYFVLGAGSNSLVMDDHWPGAVLLCSNLNSLEVKKDIVTVEAGVENTPFSKVCLNHELQGASWMNYLPGQIGSTVRMNARCYNGEISQIVDSVSTVSKTGEIKSYKGSDVFHGYKDTLFMENGDFVAEVTFKLSKGNPEVIQHHMEFCRKDRESKHQFMYPSCGCVFKNDYEVGIPSGMLLEDAGVRQLSNEKVEISPYHANFVFNKGAAAHEILCVSLDMRDLVYEKFGVWLEFEMELLGVIPESLKARVCESKIPNHNQKELAPLKRKFQG